MYQMIEIETGEIIGIAGRVEDLIPLGYEKYPDIKYKYSYYCAEGYIIEAGIENGHYYDNMINKYRVINPDIYPY